MAYSEFSIKMVKEEFGLGIVEHKDLFSGIEPAQIDEYIKGKLEENVPLALAINTEKARSEFIIAFVLLELRSSLKNRISLFSGIDFEVDREKRLTGFCYFIISLSSEQFFLTTPVVMVVEAKNENIIAGLGQCLAEMIASRLFNESEKNGVETIYGVVTTGSVWRFLKLTGNTAFIDKREYHIDAIDRIMGILAAMVNQQA
uniref:Uncharacterized protein n=1 Tax=Candidatus Kentrum sp. LPFa TaxID=2126335 RepID=A0A450X8A8_9GAMM|nr:MAG: hypothetical protein BECKLPF1236A_GA0070988_104771 [Candidatus Kentron sp. LPFa]VFK36175.1 MAG: hypothetical protein BECKLPF1236C_GA0070990_105051 [Candidatus Kentron sp. LPFa]